VLDEKNRTADLAVELTASAFGKSPVKKLRVGVLSEAVRASTKSPCSPPPRSSAPSTRPSTTSCPIGSPKTPLGDGSPRRGLLQGKHSTRLTPRTQRHVFPRSSGAGFAIVIPPDPRNYTASMVPFQSGATEMSRRWTDHSIQVDRHFPRSPRDVGEDGTIQGLLETRRTSLRPT